MRLAALLLLSQALAGCFVDHPPELDATATTSTSTGSTTSTTSTTSTASTDDPTSSTSTSTAASSSTGQGATTGGAGSSSGGAPPQTCPQELYGTTFDVPPALTPLAGEWSTALGVYSTTAAMLASISVLPDLDADGYTASTVLRFTSPDSAAGVFVYASGTLLNFSGAFVRLSPSSGIATIGGISDNTVVVYSELKIDPPPLNTWINLSVGTFQGDVSVAIDGELIGYTGTPFTHGTAGLLAQTGKLEFDEFTVCGQ